ncbi:MAG: hypothetical protein HYZ14_03805 [Bacteroidetes bacterium]|nr:hypothetical protein [Bacteroidota bacterium]
MKKSILLCALISLLNAVSFSQLTLSVSPGINLNGATVGYKISDRFVPYAGFRYMRASMDYTYSGSEYSAIVPGQINQVEYTDEAKVNFMLPTIGLKTFLVSRNKLKAYVSVSASKPMLTGKYIEDGTVNQQVKEELRNMHFFAAECGFGMEYFFDANFSIGGEFGLRYMKFRYSAEHDETIYDPFSGASTPATHEHDYNFALSPTYSKIALNFYF